MRATSNNVLPGLVNTSLKGGYSNPGLSVSPNTQGLGKGLSFSDNGTLMTSDSPTAKLLSQSQGIPVSTPVSPQQGLLSSALGSISSPVKSITHTASDGSSIKVDTHAPQDSTQSNSQGGINASQIKSNLSEYYKSNPQDPTNPAYQTGGNKSATTSAIGTGGAPVNPFGDDPTSYASQLWKANQLQNNATNYKADLTRGVENTARQGALGNVAAGMAGQQSVQGIAEEQRLSDLAKNQTALAQGLSPVSQFGVLTNPATGQPVGGGSAGSAAFNGGVIGGQQAAGQTYAGLAVANNAAKGVKATLDDYIANNPGVNASSLTLGNAITQWASGKQLGDPKVQTFLNDVQEYVSTLAPILGIGGAPTDAKTFIANSFVNPLASGQSISQVLANIETLANNKLAYFATAGSGGKINPQITSQGNSSDYSYDW